MLVYDGLQRCPYLSGRVARMPLYRQLRRLTPFETDQRFANAERRVGHSLYQTACPTCSACKGIRIPVAKFRPSKSQRRVANRWPDTLRIEIDNASYSDEKLALFNAHKRQRGLNDPDDTEMDAIGYMTWLVQSCFETVEMRYYLADRLVGVGILDVGATAASSVYFYFDPSEDIARLSPGTFSVLQEIELCRRTGRTHHYLGLWVEDCRQLNYKSSYYPHELLGDGAWRQVDKP
jgi:arginine-tRNA-protein transferase